MREITSFEIQAVSGGSDAYDAGYATGKFVVKVLTASAVIITIYAAVASA